MKTIKIPAQRYWRRFGALINNFKHIPHHFVVFLLLLNLSMYLFAENFDNVMIHIRHITYTVLYIKSKHYK